MLKQSAKAWSLREPVSQAICSRRHTRLRNQNYCWAAHSPTRSRPASTSHQHLSATCTSFRQGRQVPKFLTQHQVLAFDVVVNHALQNSGGSNTEQKTIRDLKYSCLFTLCFRLQGSPSFKPACTTQSTTATYFSCDSVRPLTWIPLDILQQ